MFKYAILSTILLTSLFARENPFFPKEGEPDLPYTTNQITTFYPLKQSSISVPNTARILQKVTVTYKNLDGTIDEKSIDLNNTIDWHLPIFISQSYGSQGRVQAKPKKEHFLKIKGTNFITLYKSAKSMKLVTNDKKIRDFLLVKPHRIVIDFKRNTDFGSFVKSFKKSIFKSIKIGTHEGYYRVVIELDGVYDYQIKTTRSGYFITLK